MRLETNGGGCVYDLPPLCFQPNRDGHSVRLTANEVRDLGRIKLDLGSLTEQVSVTAEATPVQTASSERTALVSGTQVLNVTLKGRDMYGLLVLLPGIQASEGDATNTGSFGSQHFKGQQTNTKLIRRG
jgi:hypothetical protein